MLNTLREQQKQHKKGKADDQAATKFTEKCATSWTAFENTPNFTLKNSGESWKN